MCLLNIILYVLRHCFICLKHIYECMTTCVAGCPETLVLNMSKLVWSVLTSVKQRDPLASEVTTLFLF